MNDSMAGYAARNIIKRMSRRGMNLSDATVGVLGVTFKDINVSISVTQKYLI